MATAAQALSAIASKLGTLTTSRSGARAVSDLSVDAIEIPAGEVHYQLRHTPALDIRDTLTTLTVLGVEVAVVARLAAAETEAAYTEGDALTWRLALADPDWWTALAEVQEFRAGEGGEPSGPTLADLEREEDRVTFTVTATLVVTPD